jgi:hypothetical protein
MAIKLLSKVISVQEAIEKVLIQYKDLYKAEDVTVQKLKIQLLRSKPDTVANIFLSYDCDYEFNSVSFPEADWKYSGCNYSKTHLSFVRWSDQAAK